MDSGCDSLQAGGENVDVLYGKGRPNSCSMTSGSSSGCRRPAYTKRAAGRRYTLFSTSLDTRVFAQHTTDERENALTSLFRIRSSFAVVRPRRSCE